METKEKIPEVNSQDISGLLKKYNNIESGYIVLCFKRGVHLSIIRQREKDLNHNVLIINF